MTKVFDEVRSSVPELDGSWEDHTYQAEVKHLRAYQVQERELYYWLVDGGNFAALKQWAAIYGIDMNNLSVDTIDNAANMPPELRAGLYRALRWYNLARRVVQLVEYQARQKRRTSHGTRPRWLRAQMLFQSIKPFATSDRDLEVTEMLCPK